MTGLYETFDPWGPISVALFETGDADFVENAVSQTGLIAFWRPLTEKEAYSHALRIRARKPEIGAAYRNLPDDHRGLFVQQLLRALFARRDGDAIRAKLEGLLTPIGWRLTPEGLVVTEDALLTEAFFPAATPYDAYVSIREILGRAKAELTIVDGYLGPSLLSTLRAVSAGPLKVRFLTMKKGLKPDFGAELTAFRSQFPQVAVEVRLSDDFHDRFIVLDETAYFHVGASIKDAGSRAFMISRAEDPAVIEGLKRSLDQSWSASVPFCG